MNHSKPRSRKLKPWVKRTLIFMGVFVLILAVRPWRFAANYTSGHNLRDTVASPVAVVTPLNKIVSNSDSEIPEAAKFDRTVEHFLRKWEVVGASLAIMKAGNLIYSKGYGYADSTTHEKTEVRHIFRIASISKLITAVGIMKLYENGLLSMDQPVFGARGILSQYKDYTDKKIEKITVENLLRHQGGFTIKAGDPMFDPAKAGIPLPATPQSILTKVLKNGIRYAPGSRTAYSNTGYMVLSLVIEKIAGMPYEQYIKDSVLAPIGCYDMHIAHNDPALKHDNEVCYYETKDAEPIPAADGSGKLVPKSRGGNNVESLLGAGGWIVSPVELLKFVAAVDPVNPHKNFLKPQTVKYMTKYEKGVLPIGWSNVSENGDWWRSGAMAGTSAMLRRQNNGYTWVFITNTSSWKGYLFANHINSMLHEAFGSVTDWPEKDLFREEEEF